MWNTLQSRVIPPPLHTFVSQPGIETQRTKYRSRFDNKKEEITEEQENLEINSEDE